MNQRRANEQPYHRPVMVSEVVSWLEPAANGWVVDGTFGGGGHSRALLDRYPNIRVVGIDRDPDAIAEAPKDPRLIVVRGNYSDMASTLGESNLPPKVDGILLDLGVSSHQLDVASRGFSYHSAGPLDMRMGPDAERTAGELVNDASEEELVDIFRRFGEERYARRIANAIIVDRPHVDTAGLSACIANAVPAAARRSKHPARRVFQALRIAVNDELGSLVATMATAADSLDVGGRLVVLSYHSLEDRIVKRSLALQSMTCTCPPEIPVCNCETVPTYKVLTAKAVRPTSNEISNNPRARSAVLRVAERVAP